MRVEAAKNSAVLGDIVLHACVADGDGPFQWTWLLARFLVSLESFLWGQRPLLQEKIGDSQNTFPLHLNKIKSGFKKASRPSLNFQKSSELFHIAGAILIRKGFSEFLESLKPFVSDSFHPIVRKMLQELKMRLCGDAREQYTGVSMAREFATGIPRMLKNNSSRTVALKR